MSGFFFFLIGLAGLGLLFSLVMPVVTFLRASRALEEARRANERIEALARVVQDLAREHAARPVAADHPAAEAAAPAVSPAPEPGVSQPVAPVADAADALPTPVVPPVVPAAAASVSAAPAAQLAGEVVRPDERDHVPPPLDAVPPVEPDHTAHARAARTPSAPDVARHAPSLEQRIGQRWLLYVGIGAIVLGASYLVKLAFENNWITPAMRVVLSAAGGMVLIGAGLRFVRRGLGGFGHLLAGGGIAVLYVSVYAALSFYELIDRSAAFALMTVVTAGAAWLADRGRTQGLAMVALVGGFATPFLVGGDRDAHVALFAYVTVLVAGATFLARRQGWPALPLVAFVLTAFTFGTWAATYYRHEWFASVQVFLTLWVGLFLVAVLTGRGAASAPPGTPESATESLRAAVAVVIGILAPVLYHAASLTNLARHTLELLVYFILATLAGVLYYADGKRPWARLAVWVAVWLPFLGWLSTHAGAGGVRVTLFALYGLHLLSEMRAFVHHHERIDGIEVLLLHLNGLGVLAGLLLLYPTWDTDGMALAAAGVGVLYTGLGVGMRGRHDSAPLHYLALASACFAGALALYFEGAWVTVGWAVEGTLLVWLGLREKRHWLRLLGGVLLVLAAGHGLEALSAPPAVADLPFLNARALSLVAVAALLLAVARLYVTMGQNLRNGPQLPIGTCIVTAAVLVLLVITEQVNQVFGVAAWQRQVESGAMAAGTADLARQVTLSIVWAAYALVLVAIGIARRYAPIRYLAIVLFAVTIAKVFFVDLAQLDRVYRVLSVIGLGVLLIVASYLYQRFMADEDGDDHVPPAAGEAPPPGVPAP